MSVAPMRAAAADSRARDESRPAARGQDVPIFVISLPDSLTRRRSVSGNMDALGLAFEFFDAVDGRAGMPKLQKGERLFPDDCLRRYPLLRAHRLSAVETACYLSHFRLVRRCLAAGWPRVLVMEDDVLGASDLPAVLSALSDLPQFFELVRLNQTLFGAAVKVVRPLLDGRYELGRMRRPVASGAAYCLSRRGMEKYVRCFCDIRQPIDVAIDQFWETGLRCFLVRPNPVFCARKGSTLEDADRRRSRPRRLTLSDWMRGMFHRYARNARRWLYMASRFREFL